MEWNHFVEESNAIKDAINKCDYMGKLRDSINKYSVIVYNRKYEGRLKIFCHTTPLGTSYPFIRIEYEKNSIKKKLHKLLKNWNISRMKFEEIMGKSFAKSKITILPIPILILLVIYYMLFYGIRVIKFIFSIIQKKKKRWNYRLERL